MVIRINTTKSPFTGDITSGCIILNPAFDIIYVALSEGFDIFIIQIPRAYARGYRIPPANGLE